MSPRRVRLSCSSRGMSSRLVRLSCPSHGSSPRRVVRRRLARLVAHCLTEYVSWHVASLSTSLLFVSWHVVSPSASLVSVSWLVASSSGPSDTPVSWLAKRTHQRLHAERTRNIPNYACHGNSYSLNRRERGTGHPTYLTKIPLQIKEEFAQEMMTYILCMHKHSPQTSPIIQHPRLLSLFYQIRLYLEIILPKDLDFSRLRSHTQVLFVRQLLY